MLADMGAEVVRVERVAEATTTTTRNDAADPRRYVLHRGRRSVAIDLKHPDGVATVLHLVERAGALVEGFPPRRDGAHRPGPRRVPGAQPSPGLRAHHRMGPARAFATTAGHDASTWHSPALLAFARRGERPLPPLAGGRHGRWDAPAVVCVCARPTGRAAVRWSTRR